jgi:hypothetical protein
VWTWWRQAKHSPPSEAGVLAVIAEDVGRSGSCVRTAKQIAKAVGCGVRTVRRAWATVKELCHLSIEERRVPGRRVNDSNIIRIIDPEWLKWWANAGPGSQRSAHLRLRG